MSGAAELLVTLEAAGVMVSLNASGDGLKLSAATLPPAELLAQIRAAKPALLQALQPTGNTSPLAPLPEPLARLVYAASGNHLNRPGVLPSGVVMNLGEYVLTTAALYATGRDPERQLSDLWAARGAWAS